MSRAAQSNKGFLHVWRSFFTPNRVARASSPLPAISTRYAPLQIVPRNTGATRQFAIRSRGGGPMIAILALLGLILLLLICALALLSIINNELGNVPDE